MHVTRIIPHRVWVHTSGRRASVYGSVPWVSDAEREEWSMVTQGYTWGMSNGTVGFCRVPAKNYEEAEEFARKVNGERRVQLEAHAAAFPEQSERCAAMLATIPMEF